MLSPTKQIPIQSLLSKTTTCLTRTATTFFVPHVKKCLSKTAIAKNYPSEKWEVIHKKICISDFIYFIATLKCKVCLMFIKTVHLHSTYVFPIIVVVRVLDSNPGVPGPKLLDGSKVNLPFHSSAVN